jgi:hypothetical protein
MEAPCFVCMAFSPGNENYRSVRMHRFALVIRIMTEPNGSLSRRRSDGRSSLFVEQEMEHRSVVRLCEEATLP